jgi:hypothetical protein
MIIPLRTTKRKLIERRHLSIVNLQELAALNLLVIAQQDKMAFPAGLASFIQGSVCAGKSAPDSVHRQLLGKLGQVQKGPKNCEQVANSFRAMPSVCAGRLKKRPLGP